MSKDYWHDIEAGTKIPENINEIFKNSCYGCHNSESKNEKGREILPSLNIFII